MSTTSLVTRVARLIDSDDTDDSQRIIDSYRNATPVVQEAIDDIFISLCGYQLKTLIAGKEEEL